MKLDKDSLLRKFPLLLKYKDQAWFSEESIKHDVNHKELPLRVAFLLIQDTIEFIEKTKFRNNWEAGFSIKIRLQHAKEVLSFFCEDTEEEKTIKGSNLL